MIISRTPYRISFFGGGTDYPAWYRQHGGAVLATTIDKFCYLTCRHLPAFFEHSIRTVYSKIESCQTLEEIAHPSVREVLRFLHISGGVEIHHDGDLPARSGTGSSSAFTVGLLHALHALSGRPASKERLVRESIHIEQNILGETVGSQDQVLAACGGMNHVVFHPSGKITVSPALISRDRKAWLNQHLMLFFTGIKRTASDVAASYATDIGSRGTQLETMQRLVQIGLAVLAGQGDIGEFGELLHEAWLTKSSFSSSVSSPLIDEIYSEALAAGAIGGKLLGAGGGGFLLVFARPEHQPQVQRRLARLIQVPFQFEEVGSQIIFRDSSHDHGSGEPQAHRILQEAPEISLAAA